MNIDKAFPSKYLKASDFDDVDMPCTIKHVRMEQVGQGGDEVPKAVIYFQEMEKGMICNTTNKNIIVKLYGKETNDWTGQKVVLWVNHDVQFKGEIVSAIRVRSRAPLAQLDNADPARQPVRKSEQQTQNVKDPQTLAFVLTVEGLDADEHVYKLLEDFGYGTLETVPVTERDQFIVFVQTLAKRATAK